ncbi:uncharacterized protein LOC129732793 isoform X2 [Wyeomyia smithii]|uniref:uncharacterized protein LOC129732793 isoform X2 n=1 Tax=Wyeomyia smithii TaxID=174621 RepID=UPI002467B836|nr:uncharacterized protein LOC129732793 isoform X2 [Wyeomyia smithii]
MGKAPLVLLLLVISWSWHVLGQQTTPRTTTKVVGSPLRSSTRASQTTRTPAKAGQLVNTQVSCSDKFINQNLILLLVQRTTPRTTYVTAKKVNQPTTKAVTLTTRTTARTTQGATKNAQLKQTSTTKRMNLLTTKSATLKAPFTTASTTLARLVQTTTKRIPPAIVMKNQNICHYPNIV